MPTLPEGLTSFWSFTKTYNNVDKTYFLVNSDSITVLPCSRRNYKGRQELPGDPEILNMFMSDSQAFNTEIFPRTLDTTGIPKLADTIRTNSGLSSNAPYSELFKEWPFKYEVCAPKNGILTYNYSNATYQGNKVSSAVISFKAGGYVFKLRLAIPDGLTVTTGENWVCSYLRNIFFSDVMQFSANTPYTIYARVCTKTVDSLVPGFSIDTTGGTTPGLSKKDSGLFPQSVLCGCNDGSKSAPNGWHYSPTVDLDIAGLSSTYETAATPGTNLSRYYFTGVVFYAKIGESTSTTISEDATAAAADLYNYWAWKGSGDDNIKIEDIPLWRHYSTSASSTGYFNACNEVKPLAIWNDRASGSLKLCSNDNINIGQHSIVAGFDNEITGGQLNAVFGSSNYISGLPSAIRDNLIAGFNNKITTSASYNLIVGEANTVTGNHNAIFGKGYLTLSATSISLVNQTSNSCMYQVNLSNVSAFTAAMLQNLTINTDYSTIRQNSDSSNEAKIKSFSVSSGNNWIAGSNGRNPSSTSSPSATDIVCTITTDEALTIPSSGNPFTLTLVAKRAGNSSLALSFGGLAANGNYNVALGAGGSATNLCSLGTGIGTKSSGMASTTFGVETKAEKDGAIAAGYRTIAAKAYQLVFGTYNTEDTGTRNISGSPCGKYVEIVGNGSGSSSRSNARTLDWSGNEYLAGNIEAQAFYARSDRRLKENLTAYKAKKSILDLPVYKFDFITGEKDQVGCLAQDLKEICPEVVKEDNNGYLSIEEPKIVYLLLDEVKKLTNKVKELESKLK